MRVRSVLCSRACSLATWGRFQQDCAVRPLVCDSQPWGYSVRDKAVVYREVWRGESGQALDDDPLHLVKETSGLAEAWPTSSTL